MTQAFGMLNKIPRIFIVLFAIDGHTEGGTGTEYRQAWINKYPDKRTEVQLPALLSQIMTDRLTDRRGQVKGNFYFKYKGDHKHL